MGKNTLKFLSILASFALLAMSCGRSDQSAAAEGSADATANEAEATPDPDLVYIGGIPVYTRYSALEPLFQQKNDTTYVINFWATWCKPCVEELPYFEDLHAKYKDQKVRVILVSLDFPRQIESKVVPFVARHQLQSDVVVLAETNSANYIDKIDPSWSGAIPITVIYNAKDRQFIGQAFDDYEELEETLKGFL